MLWRVLSWFTLLVFFLSPGLAQERVWDQEAARQKVQATLDLEKTGQPWNDIDWMTSIEEAESMARKEDKPVFVFVFLRKPVGPKEAPC